MWDRREKAVAQKNLESVLNNPNASYPSPVRAWIWVFALVLAYICSYVDRQILSLMVDPIKADLDITDSQFSLLHGLSFAILYCLLGLPFGSLVDRYPRKHIIAGGVLLWCAMTAMCGMAAKFWHLFAARVGVGVGEAALSPGAYSLLSDSFPKHRLGLALSVYTMGAGLGAGLAYMVGGSLYSWISSWPPFALPGIGAMKPWQTVFVLVAIPGMPVAALIWLLSEPARQDRNSTTAPPLPEVFRFVMRRRRFMTSFLLGMSCITGATTATMAWAPAALMRGFDLTAAEAGLRLGAVTMVAFPFGLFVGAWVAAFLAKRGMNNSELFVMVCGAALTVPAALSLAIASSASELIVAIAALMIVTNVPFGIAAAVLQSMTPNEMRGRMTAIYLFSVNIFGLTLGPLLPALWTDFVFDGQGSRVGQSIAVTVAFMAALAGSSMFIAWRLSRSRLEV
jgi:MFS family permease